MSAICSGHCSSRAASVRPALPHESRCAPRKAPRTPAIRSDLLLPDSFYEYDYKQHINGLNCRLARRTYPAGVGPSCGSDAQVPISAIAVSANSLAGAFPARSRQVFTDLSGWRKSVRGRKTALSSRAYHAWPIKPTNWTERVVNLAAV